MLMAIQQFTLSLPMMLYRALDAVMPRFRKLFSEFGITEQQWRVLRVLWERDEVAVRELSDLVLISAPSLVGSVGRLQSGGFVRRRRSDQDRRNVFVRATPKGQDLKALLMPRVQDIYLELKYSVDAEVWRNVLQGLQELSLIEQPGSASRPLSDSSVRSPVSA